MPFSLYLKSIIATFLFTNVNIQNCNISFTFGLYIVFVKLISFWYVIYKYPLKN